MEYSVSMWKLSVTRMQEGPSHVAKIIAASATKKPTLLQIKRRHKWHTATRTCWSDSSKCFIEIGYKVASSSNAVLFIVSESSLTKTSGLSMMQKSKPSLCMMSMP